VVDKSTLVDLTASVYELEVNDEIIPVTHIIPVRSDNLYTSTDFGDVIEGCHDTNKNGNDECFCRLQDDKGSRKYTGTSIRHPKPYTAPFFGTNFCHTLSIDSPTCCNKLQDEAVKDLWLTGMPQDCLALTDKNKEFAWLLKDISCMVCSTDQRRFVKDKIITLERPVYE